MTQHHRRFALIGAGLAVAATTALSTVTAAAATPTTVNPIQAAAGWLTTQFVDGTHLPAPAGDHFDSKYGSSYYPNYGENADVIFGLAAAKAGMAKIDVAFDYLAANIDGYADISDSDGYGPYDGSVAKVALAAIVTGKSPTDVAGHDLMATLKTDECPATSTTCTPGAAANIYSSVSESFVVLAEARVGGKSAPTPQALDYLSSLQCSDGGFTSGVTACGSGAADLDSTSYAIMALTAAGGHAGEVAKAVSWLTGQQETGGYWVSQDVPNVDSTGLAAAALAGTGANVSRARDWLASQQIAAGRPGAGAFGYAGTFSPTTTSATSPSVLGTAQALTGLVDGGGLATLTAAGANSGVSLYAPAATLSTTRLRAGQQQTVTADGFAAGEKVSAVLHSATIAVGTVTADASGAVRLTYTVPASIASGAHDLVLTGASSGLVTTSPLTVTGASAAGSGTPVASSTASTPGASSGGATLASTSGGTADTGLDGPRLLLVGLLGALAIVAGAALVLIGRRRAH